MREFKIIGKIKSKQRARTSRNKFTGFTHSYTPKSTVEYENLIKTAYLDKYSIKRETIESSKGKSKTKVVYDLKEEYPILTEAFAIEIFCYYGLGKSFSKKRLENIKSGKERATKTPDVDNITKSVLDALNGICYEDDRLCIKAKVEKEWSNSEEEYILVKIYENPDDLQLFKSTDHPDIYASEYKYVASENCYKYVPIHLFWDKDKDEYLAEEL